MEKKRMIDEIFKCFSKIEELVDLYNNINLFDINKSLEDLYREVLNIIFKWDLINANSIKKNYPGVDLIDKEKNIFVQVTSLKTHNKIQSSINSISKNTISDVKDYKLEFKIMIIKGDRVNLRKPFDLPKNIIFDEKTDVYTNKMLIEKIYYLNIEEIKRIEHIMKLYLEKNSNINFDDIKKIENLKHESIIDILFRDLEFNKTVLSEELLNNNHIVITGDAATGKTEFCKKMVNNINKEKNKYAFMYNLVDYCGDKIEDLKPNEYGVLANDFIYFFLDGFDEILDKYKRVFINQVGNFINQYPDSHIIITSRRNYYNYGENSNTFNNFKVFNILPFDSRDIKKLANYYKVNFADFNEYINSNKLDDIVKTPFYANMIMKNYDSVKKIDSRNKIIDYIICNSFSMDKKYYLYDVPNNNELFDLLGKIAIIMNLQNKRYIELDKLSLLVNESNMKILKNSGICLLKNDRFQFIHNSFAEYLAAKKLKELSISDVKKIITIDGNTIAPNWINTIAFYLSDFDSNEVLHWIIDTNPDIIFYLEKNNYLVDVRERLFIDMFKYYEKRKVYISYTRMFDKAFIDFIYSKNTIDFLVTKINKKNHFTTIFNSICFLRQFGNLMGYEKIIKDIIIELMSLNKSFNFVKKNAIELLIDKDLINDKVFKKIIKMNEKCEDSELRTAYFYYFKKNICINNKDIFFKQMYNYYFNLHKNDDVDLVDESIEFEKVISNINSSKIIMELIETYNKLSKDNIHFYLHDSFIDDLIISINKINDKDTKIKLLVKTFVLLSSLCNWEQIDKLNNYIIDNNYNFILFKRILESDSNIYIHNISKIVNEKCLKYFYDGYIKKKYSDFIAKSIMHMQSVSDSPIIKKINNEYTKNCGENYLELIKNNIQSSNNHEKLEQEYFDLLFNKEKFTNYLNDIIYKTFSKSKVSIKSLTDEKRERRVEITNYICFILKYFGREKEFDVTMIDKYDWNLIILSEAYSMLKDENTIIVSDFQIKMIDSICKEHLNKVNFREAIKFNSDGSQTIQRICVYLWFFRNKFNLVFEENILLDMLSFDWLFDKYNYFGIQYIIENVSKEKVEKRIIENIKNKDMHQSVLINHINYCINNKIDYLYDEFEKYLKKRNTSDYEKEHITEYLMKFYSTDAIVKNILPLLNYNIEIFVINRLIKHNSKILYDYLISKHKKYPKKLIYLNFLIKINNNEALKEYYELIKRSNRVIDIKNDFTNSIAKSIGEVDEINCLETISKIYEIVVKNNFSDNPINSLFNSCWEAFRNISEKNSSNISVVIDTLETIIKNNVDSNIASFTNNLISEIKINNHNLLCESQKMEDLCLIIKELFPKQDKEKFYI